MQESINLKNKTALITGSARRIGKATALALAAEGVNIFIHYNSSKQSAENLKTELNNYKVKTWCIKADLAIPGEVNVLIENCLKNHPKIDILINNASVFPVSSFKNITETELQTTLQINSLAPLFLAKNFCKQPDISGCSIINILDSRIFRYDLQHFAYQLSKNLLHSITRMLALELAPDICVNGLAPGLILPPPDKDKSYIIERYNSNLMNRAGDLKEITDSIKFLLMNRFITGEIISLDGGQNLKGQML